MSIKILQCRMTEFVKWIATDPDKEDDIRDQAEKVRTRIKGQASEDGLVVRSTPASGSFAKRTGLRRHLRGDSVVEGQDVDLPFVVSPKTKDDESLKSLLPRFEKYAKNSYPTTDRKPTKSSVLLKFSSDLRFDIVPMLATKDDQRQVLIRSDGERRETSVQKHVEFIRSRTKKSSETAGRVQFNEVVRLFKWWREFRQSESATLEDVPSILIDLLCADAFDHCGVQSQYADTFAQWAGHIARVIKKRRVVAFSDFHKVPASAPPGCIWCVLDPVNSDNNITSTWSGLMCDELADWFTEAHDAMCDIISLHQHDELARGLNELVTIFGTPIQHNCGE